MTLSQITRTVIEREIAAIDRELATITETLVSIHGRIRSYEEQKAQLLERRPQLARDLASLNQAHVATQTNTGSQRGEDAESRVDTDRATNRSSDDARREAAAEQADA